MSIAWLVVNSFLDTPKFRGMYDSLIEAARCRGVMLRRIPGTAIAANLDNLLAAEHPAFVLFWDKDIALARCLEIRGLKVLNSSEAIRICDDKSLTAVELDAQGIPQPCTIAVPLRFTPVTWNDSPFVDDVIATLGLPLVGKIAQGSFGDGVVLLTNRDEIVEFLTSLGNRPGLVQQFIGEAAGSDYRLQTVGKHVVAAIQRTATSGDFRANLTNGGTAKTFVPPEEFERLALDVVDVLGLDFAGIDLLLTQSGPVVCEVNSNAHTVNISRETGVDVAGVIINYALKLIQ